MTTMADDDRVLTFRDLKEKKGWPYTAVHTQRLVKAGKVPKPFKTGDAGGLNLWLESDIDAFLSGRAKRARGAEP
jgi:predicted DNA-binding transcriptional regulator AlpA